MPGIGVPTVPLGLADERVSSSATPAGDAAGGVAQVQPQVGRDLVVAAAAGAQLAAERRRARSSRPRSSAVCTSSSSTVGRKRAVADARRRGRRARRASPRARRRRAGRRRAARGRGRATPARSYGASRQSKWTLTDSRASASLGPPANRPPHSRVGLSPGRLVASRQLSSSGIRRHRHVTCESTTFSRLGRSRQHAGTP